MILKNYKILKKVALSVKLSTASNTTSIAGVKTMTGSDFNTIPIGDSANSSASSVRTDYVKGVTETKILWSDLYPVVGSGETPPAVTDYQLSNDISSSIGNLTMSTVINNSGENYSIELINTISGKNNTNSNITITEVGIYKNINYRNLFYYHDCYPVLLIKEALDEPITLAPNETFKIILSWIED